MEFFVALFLDQQQIVCLLVVFDYGGVHGLSYKHLVCFSVDAFVCYFAFTFVDQIKFSQSFECLSSFSTLLGIEIFSCVGCEFFEGFFCLFLQVIQLSHLRKLVY